MADKPQVKIPTFKPFGKVSVKPATEQKKAATTVQEADVDISAGLAVAPMFAPKKPKITTTTTEAKPIVSEQNVKEAVRKATQALIAEETAKAALEGKKSVVKPASLLPSVEEKPVVAAKAEEKQVVAAKAEEKPAAVTKVEEKPKKKVEIGLQPVLTLGKPDLAEYPKKIKKLGEMIIEDIFKNPYKMDRAPASYVPTTRRAFAHSIENIYERFFLPPPPKVPDFEACAKQAAKGEGEVTTYTYQEFVREYMRFESPYRGLLVYHGLGSGKTCSAIAAAEALFSQGNKKIIVMTPYSLRKNFLKEVSFCGFRHYRLQNHWIPFDLSDPTVRQFAKNVMGLPDWYKSTRFWLPDFSADKKANYNEMKPKYQTEIRTQINAVLNSRITFINYNGITAKRLKELACQPESNKLFDNAVIVIDEVHNLIRLMQSVIEPYLTKMPGVRRKIQLEPVMPERWKPTLCQDKSKNYRRGYLFYRLLMDTRNSKIIALSGTPLINFPEELGILANVLHGYINIAEGKVASNDPAIGKKIEEIGTKNPYIDFLRVTTTPTSIQILFTPLPEGVKKVPPGGEMVGVQHLKTSEKSPEFLELCQMFKAELAKAEIALVGNFVIRSEPLLPPFGQKFRDSFLTDANTIKNELVLGKRLSGLISYYKGSKEIFMPKVIRDEVVRVPMNLYQSSEYIKVRIEEVKQELKKKSGESMRKKSAVWAEVNEISNEKQSSNYRMGSRQACNFTFPEDITRPRPRNESEKVEEAGKQKELIIDAVLERKAQTGEDLQLSTDKENEASEEDNEELAEEEDDAIEAQEVEEGYIQKEGKILEVTGDQLVLLKMIRQGFDDLAEQGKFIEDVRGELKNGRQEFAMKLNIEEADLRSLDPLFKTLRFSGEGFSGVEGEDFQQDLANLLVTTLSEEELKVREERKKVKAAKKSKATEELPEEAKVEAEGVAKKKNKLTIKEIEELRAKDLSDCKKGILPGEPYKLALLRSKRCLRQFARLKLKVNSPPPDNLSKYSSKYVAMMNNIDSSPGSNLVYSQFLQMEGIGIFSICMELNGYVPIEIKSDDGVSYEFSEKTKKSLEKGPNVKENRYILFTGEEPEEIRRFALDFFNANFSSLPGGLKEVCEKAGFTDNKKGQLCRVFCITSAGAEGLSLKNVRRVHIMEPYWNDVRLQQVKGRAVRICSHMDLQYNEDPTKNERTVEIFTYLSCFSADQQLQKAGTVKLDPDMILKDGIDADYAKEIGFPVPEGAEEYVMTSDEHLYLIATAKKNVLDSLLKVMKESAVDCRLNTYENDPDLKCLQIDGNVGDFLYHPILAQDIIESQIAFQGVVPQEIITEEKKGERGEEESASPEKVKPLQQAVKEVEEALEITYKDVDYLAVPVRDPKSKIIMSYDLFNGDDIQRTRKVGTLGADPSTGDPKGKPKLL